MDGALCEMSLRWDDTLLLNLGETKWKLPQLCADNAELFVKLEDLVRMMGHFDDEYTSGPKVTPHRDFVIIVIITMNNCI